MIKSVCKILLYFVLATIIFSILLCAINGYYTNSVKYNIRFKEETEVPNSIKFTFNPIWLGDAWYLTLKNN